MQPAVAARPGSAHRPGRRPGQPRPANARATREPEHAPALLLAPGRRGLPAEESQDAQRGRVPGAGRREEGARRGRGLTLAPSEASDEAPYGDGRRVDPTKCFLSDVASPRRPRGAGSSPTACSWYRGERAAQSCSTPGPRAASSALAWHRRSESASRRRLASVMTGAPGGTQARLRRCPPRPGRLSARPCRLRRRQNGRRRRPDPQLGPARGPRWAPPLRAWPRQPPVGAWAPSAGASGAQLEDPVCRRAGRAPGAPLGMPPDRGTELELETGDAPTPGSCPMKGAHVCRARRRAAAGGGAVSRSGQGGAAVFRLPTVTAARLSPRWRRPPEWCCTTGLATCHSGPAQSGQTGPDASRTSR